MHGYRNGIRGPTPPDKANDRAGNAAVRESDRGGSEINQPSQVSRFVRLAPAASVGGRREDVKVSVGNRARLVMHAYSFRRSMTATRRDNGDQAVGHETGVVGNHAGFRVRPMMASTQYTESGMAFHD